MIALSNIVCHQVMTFSMISDGTLKSIIELSAHPSSEIQYESAIFTWNMICQESSVACEIFCEHDILYGIANILNSNC